MWATGTRGFTLIEVLVVVAIAGVILALAAVNLFPSDEEVARRDASMLALAIEGARDDAWFGGRPTSVSLEDGRLRHWRLQPDRNWVADVAREQALGRDLKPVSLFIDGTALDPRSRLVFLPDGLGIPFRLTVEVRGLVHAIEGDAAGAVRLAQGAK
jgi:general secretion pathway protein H